jgi:hypothetical protein
MNTTVFEKYQAYKQLYFELNNTIIQNTVKHYTDLYFEIYNTITWNKGRLFFNNDPVHNNLINYCKNLDQKNDIDVCTLKDNNCNNIDNSNNLDKNKCCKLISKTFHHKIVPKKLIKKFTDLISFFVNGVEVTVENIYEEYLYCCSNNNIYYSFEYNKKTAILFAFSFGYSGCCNKNILSDEELKIFISDIILFLNEDSYDIILTGHSLGSYIVLRILEHIITLNLPKNVLKRLFVICSGLPNYDVDIDLQKINDYFKKNKIINHLKFYLTIETIDNIYYYDQVLDNENLTVTNDNKINKFKLLNTTLLDTTTLNILQMDTTKNWIPTKSILHDFSCYKKIYKSLNLQINSNS